jgi:DNA-binding transcriptional LysR family regulator
MKQAAHLEEKLKLAVDGRAGRLVVAYIDLALGGVLPEALQRYRHSFPDVQIELVRMATDVQRDRLLSGEIDVGFYLGGTSIPSVRSVLIERQSYVALVPNRHPYAERSELDVEALLQQPLVLGTLPDWSAFRRRILEEAARRSIRPLVVQETLTGEGIFALVAAGVGVSIYSQSQHDLSRSGVAVRPLTGMSGDVDLHIGWSTANLGAITERFVEEVLQTKPDQVSEPLTEKSSARTRAMSPPSREDGARSA